MSLSAEDRPPTPRCEINWTPERERYVQIAWNAGMTTQKIANLCSEQWHEHVTKSAIIGKAARLAKLNPGHWAVRMNPCRGLLPGAVRKEYQRKIRQEELTETPVVTVTTWPDPVRPTAPTVIPFPVAASQPLLRCDGPRNPNAELRRSDDSGCLYLEGDRPRNWKPCNKPLVDLRLPYCQTHFELCTMKTERQEGRILLWATNGAKRG